MHSNPASGSVQINKSETRSTCMYESSEDLCFILNMCSRYLDREARNNSGYSLMVLFNNIGAASPTRPQSVGGNPRERT